MSLSPSVLVTHCPSGDRAPGTAPADGGDLPKRGENAEKFLLLCSTHQPGPQLQNSNSICLQSRSSFQG